MIINLTPHLVRVRTSPSYDPTPQEGDRVIFSEGQARVATTSTVCGDLDGIPIITTKYGDVDGLPPPVEGTTYIVSFMVLQALPGRKDLVGPATGPKDGVIRDGNGQVYAVRAFQR